MDKSDFKEYKFARVLESMRGNNLEFLIASSPANIQYLSGYRSPVQKLAMQVNVFAIFDARANGLSMVLPTAEIPLIKVKSITENLYNYGTFYFAGDEDLCPKACDSAVTALIQALQDVAKDACRVGWDECGVTPQCWDRIENTFQSICFIPASGLFNSIRMRKHDQELTYLRRAVEIAEKSLYRVVNKLTPEMSEQEAARIYNGEVVQNGGDPTFCVITANERGAYADADVTENIIRDESIIRLDVGCSFNGYNADLARTVAVGNCSAKTKNYYNALLRGEQLAIKNICPGVIAEEIFELAVTEIRTEIPHYKRHHCGHGIGLSIHEAPSIAPGVTEQLQSGMSLCIETPYYELGWGGMQVEDMILVTDDSCEYLSSFERTLIEI